MSCAQPAQVTMPNYTWPAACVPLLMFLPARRRESDGNDCWMPGQVIPINRRPVPPPVPHSPDGSPFQSQQASVIDMLQLFQSSVDKQLSTVCEKLDSRMTILETRQKGLEDEIRSSTSSSTNSTPQSGRQRKRLISVALQVFFSIEIHTIKFSILGQNTKIKQVV